jgi:hypothetical protein
VTCVWHMLSHLFSRCFLFFSLSSPGARWQAVVSVFCALPPEPRRAVHRACCAALAPGGLFLYQGFAPPATVSEAAGALPSESEPRRPRLAVGPTDPALLASPAALLEELEGLDLEVRKWVGG